MRLGAYPAVLWEGSHAEEIYGAAEISERHRHRFEVNNAYRGALEEHGMVVAGVHPRLDLVEVVELKDHPFFIATQYHPEFRSKPTRPHPLFREFVKAAHRRRRNRDGTGSDGTGRDATGSDG